MAETIQSPTSYLDFTGLGQLRGKARVDGASVARETGQQFEALFIQMMMKSMREATPKSEFLKSESMDSYQELYDKEVSIQLSKRGVLGIGDMLFRQTGQAQPAALDPANMSKPAGMANAAAAGTAGNGFPLSVKQQELALQKAARTLVISRPSAGGFPLQRLSTIQESNIPSDQEPRSNTE